MYKRKKHQGALHHHMTKAEKAEHQRLEAEALRANGESAGATDAPKSFFGKVLARLHDLSVVQKAETLLRERVLETPAGHVVRSALGYVAKGRFAKAVTAVRRGTKEEAPSAPENQAAAA